ncbi:Imm5 family immunity protein [Phosphitispora fastidiosa]|uniref:Imm5 family immunity protein n=1 Tax=Phosphitispora fastidiosa TaxID=2837202 RepID=UPI001E527D14|nr:Imm5 family immunity protein [Phosphitispora fastidiosa]MBU7005761.1 hypothetical protein [Phosphitispora fastidiosa]
MASFPEELSKTLNLAYQAMTAHPQHDLNLGYRWLIYEQLGPGKGESRQTGSDGLKKRVNLAISATEKVLPLWGKVYPGNSLPERCIQLANQVLLGQVDANEAWKQRDLFWDHLVEMGNKDQANQVVHGAGFSAVQVLNAVLRNERFDSRQINLNLTDADVNPDEMDAAFFAAAAYANGAVWDEASDSLKRREFWEWWLKEAVPLAWEMI